MWETITEGGTCWRKKTVREEQTQCCDRLTTGGQICGTLVWFMTSSLAEMSFLGRDWRTKQHTINCCGQTLVVIHWLTIAQAIAGRCYRVLLPQTKHCWRKPNDLSRLTFRSASDLHNGNSGNYHSFLFIQELCVVVTMIVMPFY